MLKTCDNRYYAYVIAVGDRVDYSRVNRIHQTCSSLSQNPIQQHTRFDPLTCSNHRSATTWPIDSIFYKHNNQRVLHNNHATNLLHLLGTSPPGQSCPAIGLQPRVLQRMFGDLVCPPRTSGRRLDVSTLSRGGRSQGRGGSFGPHAERPCQYYRGAPKLDGHAKCRGG